MFNDKRFVDKVSVDKRGRPKNFATKENFEKFYELESSSESESDDKEEEETKKSKKDKKIDGKTPKQEKGKQVEKDKKNLNKSLKDAKKGQKALKKTEAKSKSKKQKAAESESEDKSSDIDEKIRSKLRSNGIDYARGEGELLSDSRYKKMLTLLFIWQKWRSPWLILVISQRNNTTDHQISGIIKTLVLIGV